MFSALCKFVSPRLESPASCPAKQSFLRPTELSWFSYGLHQHPRETQRTRQPLEVSFSHVFCKPHAHPQALCDPLEICVVLEEKECDYSLLETSAESREDRRACAHNGRWCWDCCHIGSSVSSCNILMRSRKDKPIQHQKGTDLPHWKQKKTLPMDTIMQEVNCKRHGRWQKIPIFHLLRVGELDLLRVDYAKKKKGPRIWTCKYFFQFGFTVNMS